MRAYISTSAVVVCSIAWPVAAQETAYVVIDIGTPMIESIGSGATSRFMGDIPKMIEEVNKAHVQSL